MQPLKAGFANYLSTRKLGCLIQRMLLHRRRLSKPTDIMGTQYGRPGQTAIPEPTYACLQLADPEGQS